MGTGLRERGLVVLLGVAVSACTAQCHDQPGKLHQAQAESQLCGHGMKWHHDYEPGGQLLMLCCSPNRGQTWHQSAAMVVGGLFGQAR